MIDGKRLSDLIINLDDVLNSPDVDATITGIVLDSRQVAPGNLFVAMSGGTTDGHRYIPDAILRGASVVIGTQPMIGLEVPYVQVVDSRIDAAILAAAFYDFPARRLEMIGVTGTDGKTTTANLIYHILKFSGLRTGMISTVNAVIGEETLDTGFHVTTPDAPDIQQYLSRMVSAGLTHVVLEATSHGLAQKRLAACEFDMGVVTNITHEHLDFHGTYEAYRESKGQLFESLAHTLPKPFHPARGAVLNRDDSSYGYLSRITQVDQLSYGLKIGADVLGEFVEDSSGISGPMRGIHFMAAGSDLDGIHFSLPISSRLVGEHNVYNCLAAISLTLGVMKLDTQLVEKSVASFEGVPGRMERIDMGQEFIAIVDFAHTPNALRNALMAARRMTRGRIIAVFGSAGLRDRAKRRLMAETSAELADLTVLTAEDPRTESLDGILEEMAVGMEAQGGVEGKTFWRIPDRREAIRFSIGLAIPGDMVIACGKGHEQSMCFGEIEYLWDDRIAMRAALAELLGLPGPGMPFLPS